ncbi:conserved hypothetical protein [delta proteobacterium NaphS2]|nr:conserved hypothetical protein [delta proteobacterium NaphS2]
MDEDNKRNRETKFRENNRLSMISSDKKRKDSPDSLLELSRQPDNRLLQETRLGTAEEMFLRILASDDKNITRAFLTNLHVFYGLVKKDNFQEDRFTRLKQDFDELKEKLAKIDDFLGMRAATSG